MPSRYRTRITDYLHNLSLPHYATDSRVDGWQVFKAILGYQRLVIDYSLGPKEWAGPNPWKVGMKNTNFIDSC